jgi:hypothetical protein
MLNLGLDLLLMTKCSLCEQLIFEENKVDVEKVLFGAKKYSVCLSCGQEMNKKDWTKKYKKRYNKFLEKKNV